MRNCNVNLIKVSRETYCQIDALSGIIQVNVIVCYLHNQNLKRLERLYERWREKQYLVSVVQGYIIKDNINIMTAFYEYLEKPQKEWKRRGLYIAPLYNNLISNGFKANYHLIKRCDVVFVGTPNEYLNSCSE